LPFCLPGYQLEEEYQPDIKALTLARQGAGRQYRELSEDIKAYVLARITWRCESCEKPSVRCSKGRLPDEFIIVRQALVVTTSCSRPSNRKKLPLVTKMTT